MPSEDLVDALRELTNVLQADHTLGPALARIAEAATVSVPACDAASIAISLEGRPATAAISARVALELDMIQYDVDEGPCIESLRSASLIRIDLVEQGDAFPHFAAGAERFGVRSVLSVPAKWGTEVVATLNLYSRTRPFDETAESMGRVLAAQIAIAVSRSPEYRAARSVLEQAQREVDDQADIGVATGLLMYNEDCTVEQAEGLLREAAEHEARTVVEVAQRIIEQQRRSP
jgi:GAF domain-containing protein